jgi:heme/copper-type cytochrome/quinol oxidase subunit 2
MPYYFYLNINSVYSDCDDISGSTHLAYESIMIQTEDLRWGRLRLLEVDKPLYLPIDLPIRVIVSSDDVLHSWAIPSLGVKIDCVPGRLNVVEFRIARAGIFYGQCSEICGTQHGMMPIMIVSLPKRIYRAILLK